MPSVLLDIKGGMPTVPQSCRQSRSSLDLTAAGGGGVLYTREITQSDCAPLMSLIAFAAGRGRAAAAEADNKPDDAAM